MSANEIYKKGLKDGIPIFLGYLAVSFSFGIQAKLIGLTIFEAGLLSATNLTSAGQFAGLLSIASNAALTEVIISQLIINSRYILMSSALSQKINPKTPILHRAAMAFGVTDEIFALSNAYPGELNPFYHYGQMTVSILGWTLGTILGVISGDILPAGVVASLSIALYGMLIAIIVPPSKENHILKGLIITSMVASFTFSVMPVVKEISPGIRLIILTLIITSFAAYFFPIKEGKDE